MILLAYAAPHRYHPFEGDQDLADAFRILLIVASFALLGVIGRAILEGLRHHDMDRGQIARFLGVAIIAASVSLGVAGRFGTPMANTIPAIIVGLAVEWYGVIEIRRNQRTRTRSEGEREDT